MAESKGSSFVILNYNTAILSCNLALKLASFNIVSQIVIVDNASTDNSKKLFEKVQNEKIKILYSKLNGGYSAGNNIGIKYLESIGEEIIFIANPDIWICKEDTIINLSTILRNNDDIGAISCMRVNEMEQYNEWQHFYHGKNIEYFLNSFYIYRKIFPFNGRSVLNKQLREINESKSKLIQVEQVPGSFFGMTTKNWKKVDYFDENLFLYFEEMTLARKLENNNLKCVIFKDSLYQHRHKYNGRGTIKKYKITANSKKYYVRNYLPASLFAKKLIILSTCIGVFEREFLEKISKIYTRRDN